MQEERFKMEIVVRNSDLDDLNHVNNVRYVKWMEDVAKAHWFHLLEKNNLENKYIWVVANHFVEYKRPALLDYKLSLETYLTGFEENHCYRMIEIKNAETGKIMIQSKSKWCYIDSKTNRPAPIPDEILDLVGILV
ncbi:acyl-CoA thioesterase [Aureivirga marina]|uniref:acyl-CoA thioesterase n=1 Tax=Aureivirga marina TaxID=1182451 RepID=UPI0018CB0530|nr:thioesterase family protein [Aureivirga marina]